MKETNLYQTELKSKDFSFEKVYNPAKKDLKKTGNSYGPHQSPGGPVRKLKTVRWTTYGCCVIYTFLTQHSSPDKSF